jgi:hypothetical protein
MYEQVGVWCSPVFTPVIRALWRLRQEDPEFEASLGCIVRHFSKKKVTVKMYDSQWFSHIGENSLAYCGLMEFVL